MSADSTVKLWDTQNLVNTASSQDPSFTPLDTPPESVNVFEQARHGESIGKASPIRQLVGHTRWVWDAVFSADSAYIVTASSDGTSKLWGVSSGEMVRTYAGHQKAVTAVAMNDLNDVQ